MIVSRGTGIGTRFNDNGPERSDGTLTWCPVVAVADNVIASELHTKAVESPALPRTFCDRGEATAE
jgi:hypothetical protein